MKMNSYSEKFLVEEAFHLRQCARVQIVLDELERIFINQKIFVKIGEYERENGFMALFGGLLRYQYKPGEQVEIYLRGELGEESLKKYTRKIGDAFKIPAPVIAD